MMLFTSRYKGQTSLIALSLMSWVLLMSWGMVQLCRLTIRSDIHRKDFHQHRMLIRDCLDRAFLDQLDNTSKSRVEYHDLRLNVEADRHQGQVFLARSIELKFKDKPEWVEVKGLVIRQSGQQLMILDFE